MVPSGVFAVNEVCQVTALCFQNLWVAKLRERSHSHM